MQCQITFFLFRHNWKRRYFALIGKTLFYYSESNLPIAKPNGAINLIDITSAFFQLNWHGKTKYIQGRRQRYGRYAAGTAMAVPVFEGEKWRRWILTYACVIEWSLRAVRRSLGCLRGLLRTFSSLQASEVSTRELKLLNFLWRYLSARRARRLGRG